jgi:5-methylcytosine-specific restriction endonuclease McrA
VKRSRLHPNPEKVRKFFDAGIRQGCCQNCGHVGPRDDFEVHHGIPKAVLKRTLAEKGKPCPPEVIWDPRNALLACSELAPNRCHPRHTTRVKPMARSALRPETWAFARSLGAWAIDRLYLDYPDDQEETA